MAEANTLSISEAAGILSEDIPLFQENFARAPDGGGQTIIDAVNSPAPAALLKTLQDSGIQSLDLSGRDMNTPEDRIRSILSEGYQTMQDNGIPTPDLAQYHEAAEMAQSHEGLGIDDALEAVKARTPLSMPQSDLQVQNDGIITLADVGDDTVQPYDETSRTFADNATEIFQRAMRPFELRSTIANGETEAIRSEAREELYGLEVETNIESTNYCELDVEAQANLFRSWQGVDRSGPREDFIVEQISQRDWDDLPDALTDNGPNPFLYPWGAMFDNVGDHDENQRFLGGHHTAFDHGVVGVTLHDDYWDLIGGGAAANALHALEVQDLKNGVIEEIHYPAVNGADANDEGQFANWERYEEACAGID